MKDGDCGRPEEKMEERERDCGEKATFEVGSGGGLLNEGGGCPLPFTFVWGVQKAACSWFSFELALLKSTGLPTQMCDV